MPFQPKYLLIMAGTNIFLTLPPINPDNIKKVFDESTAPDWQEQMRLVNDFIRTQVHIDVEREMQYTNGILPSKLAVDGLHLDITGKKKIATAVNTNWVRIKGLPWQSWNE